MSLQEQEMAKGSAAEELINIRGGIHRLSEDDLEQIRQLVAPFVDSSEMTYYLTLTQQFAVEGDIRHSQVLANLLRGLRKSKEELWQE